MFSLWQVAQAAGRWRIQDVGGLSHVRQLAGNLMECGLHLSRNPGLLDRPVADADVAD